MVAKKTKKFNFKRFKKIFYFLIISSLAVLFIVSCFNIFQKRMETEKELKILNGEIDELSKERDLLNITLGETYSDEFLERIAREDLGMQKPGEIVYIIKKETIEQNMEEKQNYNLFERIINWLKSLPE